MLTALIVDDEYEIREGLRKRFPWSEFGIRQVLVADDGDIALQMALQHRPELIVTDVKMNRMSGLGFLRELQPFADYRPESIVISGYDDFELVKQALKIGVSDYILKPINMNELKDIVGKTAETIARRRAERLHEEQLYSQVRFAIPKMREELLREMFEKEYDSYWEIRRRHRLQSLDLEWMVKLPMLLLIIEADDMKAIGNRQAHDKELINFGIGNVVHQTLEEEFPYPFALSPDSLGRWVVMLACSRPEHGELAKGLAELCIQRINRFVKVHASAGMREAPGTIEQLHEMFDEASSVLEKKAAYGGNRLLTDQWPDEDAENKQPSLKDPDEALDLVRYGTDEDIAAAMDQFVDMVRSWKLVQLKDVQQGIFEWLYEIVRRAASAGVAGKMLSSNPIALWEQLEQYDTLQSLKEQVEHFLIELAAECRKFACGTSQIVTEAEKIIRQDYAEGLTLQSVASAVHVTPVWLSKLFKKEKRMTFLEYLTAIRIEKAKEMLGDVSYKVYQISYQVGYKDPVHFSKLFKKHVGCTPKEFRKQQGIADE